MVYVPNSMSHTVQLQNSIHNLKFNVSGYFMCVVYICMIKCSTDARCMYVVYMYVCIYVSLYLCMYVCMYLCTMYVCMFVCTMYVCMFVCGYVNFVVIIHIGIITFMIKCHTDELVEHHFKDKQVVHYELCFYTFDFINGFLKQIPPVVYILLHILHFIQTILVLRLVPCVKHDCL